MEPILQIKHLTHTYGVGTPFQRSAVEDMSFEVREGEFLGIMGHTGSGKSTLIQHLNGLLKPTSGQVLLAGKDIWAEPKKIREVRFRVGLVFQYPEYQLFEETVYKDIAFGPAQYGPYPARSWTGASGRRPVWWGSGMTSWISPPLSSPADKKRRWPWAGVLAMEPDVLILDEPTAGLEPGGPGKSHGQHPGLPPQ